MLVGPSNDTACGNSNWSGDGACWDEVIVIDVTNNGTFNLTTLTTAEIVEMTAKAVVLAIIVVLTIVGNILVLVAVFVNSHLRSTTNYFIVNLAVADLLLGTTVLPFSASYEVLQRWSFGQTFCDVWAAVDVLCCTASIMSLCVISLDRYIGVSRPLTYTTIMTERRSILLILVVWASSVVISIGPLFGWKEPPSQDDSVCNVTSQLGYVLFSVSGSFYIPTIVILIVYFRIYRAAVRQTKFLEKGVKTTKSTDATSSHAASEVTLRVHTGGGARFHQSCDNLAGPSPNHRVILTGPQGRLAKFKRQKRAAKTLGIVVGVFILCWFPFFFVLPLRSITVFSGVLTVAGLHYGFLNGFLGFVDCSFSLRKSAIFRAFSGSLCSSCEIPSVLFQLFFWLGYCNSCLNPMIYAKSSREFKRAFKRILRCRLGNPPANKPPYLREPPPSWKHCTVAMRSTYGSGGDQDRARTMPTSGRGGMGSRKASDVSFILETSPSRKSLDDQDGLCGVEKRVSLTVPDIRYTRSQVRRGNTNGDLATSAE